MAYARECRQREEGVERETICPAVLDTHRSHRGFACSRPANELLIAHKESEIVEWPGR